MKHAEITRDQLATRLAKKDPPLLIDVLPEDEFQCAHLPGARNACVYNVTFLDDDDRFLHDLGASLAARFGIGHATLQVERSGAACGGHEHDGGVPARE